jgi:hypothetical protein
MRSWGASYIGERQAMPVSSRRVTIEDLLHDADHERADRRAAVLASQGLRRVRLGPSCTLTFENYDTVLSRLQEALAMNGGREGAQDELAAYNRLVPQGRELVATVIFEPDDPARPDGGPGQRAGVEEQVYVQIDVERVYATPERDIERTGGGGTAPIHVLRFPLTEDDSAAFGDYERPVMIGCDHPHYGHLVLLGEDVRAELARDLDHR